MKVRVLYPSALADEKKPPAAGDVIDVGDDRAEALIAAGYVEDAKAEPVEQATAAPGEKRKAGRPRKTKP